MRKLKKFLVGALSVLTFGLVVITGRSVKATDSGNYYYYKNSTTLELVYNDSTAGKNNISFTGSITNGNGSRDLTITDSLLPNGAAVASGNTFIKVAKEVDISFTIEDSFIFKMNTFINSKNGSISLKDSNAIVLDTKSVSGAKGNVILGTDDILDPGTYTFTSTQEINIYEIYINIQEQEGDGSTIIYNYCGHGTNATVLNQTSLPNPLPSVDDVTGYTFGGWYLDSSYNTAAVAGASINATTTLYAKWVPNYDEWCTVTFDSNGGSSVTSISGPFGTTVTLPSASKTGYYLEGWDDGDSIVSGSYTLPSKNDITLTASWKESIEFDEECTFSKADNNNTAATSNAMFTASGSVNTNSGTTVSFNGNTYSTPLKMQTGTTLSFTLPKKASVYVVFVESNGTCKFDSGSKVTAENHIIIKELEAGSHEIGKADTANIGFVGVIYEKASSKASVTLESQTNNNNGDSIRYITTLKGVELADVTSWSVSFTLTGVANAVTTAEFTTLYLAVAGTNGKDAVDGTFYLVYTITEIPTTANGKELTATMTITFADGSTKTTNIALDTIAVTE